LLLGSLFVKSTLAGNLTINTSGIVQFGQGQTCISVPGANASGKDAFKVNSVYWSSTEYVANTNKAYTRYLVQASSEGQDLKNNTLGSSTSGQYDNVRPIREF